MLSYDNPESSPLGSVEGYRPHRALSRTKIVEKVNSLSKLGLRSWPYLVGGEAEDGEVWFLGVRGEIE